MFLFKKHDLFRRLLCIVTAGIFFLLTVKAEAQFAPPAGQPGSTAVKADSVVFVQWASSCVVTRGYMEVSDTTLGYASYGVETYAVGMADNDVISLGDRGYAILYFDIPIANGPGVDFAVFENSFNDEFLELAFVEVSSDGIRFFRFGSTSNTQTEEQVGTFGTLDATKLHNLAGKYRAGYGTPFDLEELKDSTGLDISNIVAVRIVDVVGSINPEFGSYDNQGAIINDPWPTPFESSGFDLDAIGVIHDQNHTVVNELVSGPSASIAPNPAAGYVMLTGLREGTTIVIFDQQGRELYSNTLLNGHNLRISLTGFPKGLLFVKVRDANTVKTWKLIHL